MPPPGFCYLGPYHSFAIRKSSFITASPIISQVLQRVITIKLFNDTDILLTIVANRCFSALSYRVLTADGFPSLPECTCSGMLMSLNFLISSSTIHHHTYDISTLFSMVYIFFPSSQDPSCHLANNICP